MLRNSGAAEKPKMIRAAAKTEPDGYPQDSGNHPETLRNLESHSLVPSFRLHPTFSTVHFVKPPTMPHSQSARKSLIAFQILSLSRHGTCLLKVICPGWNYLHCKFQQFIPESYQFSSSLIFTAFILSCSGPLLTFDYLNTVLFVLFSACKCFLCLNNEAF